MKKSLKYIGALATMLCGSFFGMQAQEQQPNRLLIINQNGNYKGLTLENLEQVALREVDGEVFVEANILEIDGTESITVQLTKSFLCETFQFTVAPHIVVQGYNELALKTYVQNQASQRYDTDFEAGIITGMSLKPGTKYDLLVLAYDSYNTPAGLTITPFETEPAEIIGNPQVTHEIVKRTKDEFVITFYPNEDVGGYYVMGFESGSIEEYLNMWGPWMGCTTISELIEVWNMGQPPLTEEHTYTFNRQNDFYPGELYDIVVAIKDVDGNFIEPDIFTASTLVNGGEGEAYVDVEVYDYTAEDWYGELKPSLYLQYKPNSETFRFRTTVQYADDYEMYTPEEWEEDLCQDPPQVGMDNWFWYDEQIHEYQCDTNTEFVILTAAQNANREWGPVKVMRYTTPAECPGMPETRSAAPRAPKIQERGNSDATVIQGAKMPSLPAKMEIQLLNVN